jgi:hypothetical protein
VGPVRLRSKALTLRAACGSRPLLTFVPGDAATPTSWIETDAALCLEGLELRSTVDWRALGGDESSRVSAVAVRGGTLRATRCRFAVSPRNACLALLGSRAEVSACQFATAESLAVYWAPGPGDTLVLCQDILVAQWAVGVDLDRHGTGAGDALLRIDHCTFRGSEAVETLTRITRSGPDPDEPPRLRLRVEADGSVFGVSHLLTLGDRVTPRRPGAVLPTAPLLRQLRSRVRWHGQDNLYPAAPAWLSVALRGRPVAAIAGGPADLAAWGRLWDGSDERSASVELAFRGPRRAPDAAGHALAPGTGDATPRQAAPRGADVSQVGPAPPVGPPTGRARASG